MSVRYYRQLVEDNGLSHGWRAANLLREMGNQCNAGSPFLWVNSTPDDVITGRRKLTLKEVV